MGYLRQLGLAVIMFSIFTMARAAAGQPSLSAEALTTVRSVDEAVYSPNSEWIAYTITQSQLETNANIMETWIVAVSGASPPQRFPLPGAAPIVWSPDSRGLVYTEPTKEGTRLWRRSVPDGRVEPVFAQPLAPLEARVSDLKWSPDGRYIAYLVRPRTPGAAPALEPMTGIEVGISWNWRDTLPAAPAPPSPPQQLWVAEVATGEEHRCCRPDEDVSTFDWAPDSRHLVGSVQPPATQQKTPAEGNPSSLQLTDVSGAESTFVQEAGIGGYCSWAPNGRWIAYTSKRGLVVTPVTTTGTATRIARAPLVISSYTPFLSNVVPACSLTGDSIDWLAYEKQRSVIYRTSLDQRTVTQIYATDRWIHVLSYNRSGTDFVAAIDSVIQPDALVVGSVEDLRQRTLVSSQQLNPQLASVSWPTWERLQWRSRDGKFTIHGTLIKPPNMKPGRKYPLIVAVEGGEPSGVINAFNLGASDYYPTLTLASEGYLVLWPNTRGRDGYGKAFEQAIETEQSFFAHPYEDLMAGVDLLIKQGMADPHQLGIMGWSYGGGLAAYTVTRTDRFRAAAIGESNWHTLLKFRWDTWTGVGEKAEHRHAIHNPYDPAQRALGLGEDYLWNLHNIRTPSLLEFGIDSMAAYIGRPLFQGLQYFGVPSELIVYPRTGHSIEEPRLRLDSFHRKIAWFDYWVRDYPHPDAGKQARYNTWKMRRSLQHDYRWLTTMARSTISNIEKLVVAAYPQLKDEFAREALLESRRTRRTLHPPAR